MLLGHFGLPSDLFLFTLHLHWLFHIPSLLLQITFCEQFINSPIVIPSSIKVSMPSFLLVSEWL